MNGQSKEFPIKLDRMAIADISEIALERHPPQQYIQLIMDGAPKHDLDTAKVLLALETYLTERRVQPDFVVVLGE